MSTFIPQRDRIFSDLSALVSFNSPHSVPELADEHAAAAEWVEGALRDAGLDVSRHPTIDNADTIIARSTPLIDGPQVLLYSHYDVVPAGDPAKWTSDPFTLTERNGRWYGRGASDCKGNVAMHLETLRLLRERSGERPDNGGFEGLGINLVVVVEGSEELGGGGLEVLLEEQPELFAADAILIADSGNVAVGVPTLTTSLRGGAQLKVTVKTLNDAVHSGTFGGAAPDPVAALIRMLDSLRDEKGRTVIDGVECTQTWSGQPYDSATFRADGGVLDGVDLMGGDDEVADLVWARPAVSVIGFSSTPVDQAVNAIVPHASAQLNLRTPAEMDPRAAAEALREHLLSHAPWNVHVEVDIEDINNGFATDPAKPAVQLLGQCLQEAYDGAELAVVGSGGSIPLTAALQKQFPDAEIAMFGVEDALARIHSADESVDPTEIEAIAVAEALFLTRYGATARR
ncbi:M20/M25/M40 family metallo-hydrolase [Corynebacterium aquatimens]|uniref:Acetylornithine deacetylase/succinyl-diaminopimelate desuccinylase-like protein n=1 Tax=Corynebacterium aquatimens TaxID=1190508 RepID=A0A931GWB5_9CORY|nr:M20/M25/M40 family metallo-hydrolase [Corynebacterium aquatimens]MBG6122371.1 acetylornithine deacetylase/succinyl-diaminopimelate desuccinylase-like protein [Corynebacterium aquatimens]WJY65086.1 putative succinyl-diaminopimelate desuccinylase [Corynebacterium aquatimens]